MSIIGDAWVFEIVVYNAKVLPVLRDTVIGEEEGRGGGRVWGGGRGVGRRQGWDHGSDLGPGADL